MKLLKKVEIALKKSDERKKEIEEGVKLAKTIDRLRETKNIEEENLRKFRENSLIEIQKQIDSKINERKLIDEEIKEKEKKRFELEAPLDLKNEWNKVEKKLEEITNDKKEASEKYTQAITKEIEVISRSKDLDSKELRVKELESHAERLVNETQLNYEKSKKIREDIEYEKEKEDKAIQEKLSLLHEKEKELKYQERDIILQKESLRKEKEEILKEKRHIASQQESLRTAWNNIKKLKQL